MALLEPATVPIKDDVCAKLAGMRPNLSARGISSLSLFGSVARDEAHEDSDIDLAIETHGKFGLFDMAAVKTYLERHMHRKVDLVFVASLSPRRRETVLRDLTPIF